MECVSVPERALRCLAQGFYGRSHMALGSAALRGDRAWPQRAWPPGGTWGVRAGPGESDGVLGVLGLSWRPADRLRGKASCRREEEEEEEDEAEDEEGVTLI